jgi:hypothetical protein
LFQINAAAAPGQTLGNRAVLVQGDESRKDRHMIRIAIVVWMMLGTALAGSAMVAVLSIESLAGQPMKFIPIAVLCGFAVAMPLSYLVARKIGRPAVG